jgi:hypothetical protein
MSNLPTGPEFSVKYPDALDAKKVLFWLEHEGKLLSLVGTFRIHGPPEKQWVNIECRGLPFRFELGNTLGYVFRLPQQYVDSLVATKPASGADFELRIPLLTAHHISKTSKQP